jgi:hypothetical protein
MRGRGKTYAVTVHLSQPMFEELQHAATEASVGRTLGEEEIVSPSDFATECVESILASRRLEAMVDAHLAPGDRRVSISA